MAAITEPVAANADQINQDILRVLTPPSPLWLTASSLASMMRCTQNVHFSMTPLLRTVTSGFSARCSGSRTDWS